MEKEIVYTASKGSYGSGFFDICNTLDELKKTIVAQEEKYSTQRMMDNEEYTDDMYTEELFEKCSKDKEYELYEIHLHQNEEIVFSEYDGTSDFEIVQKAPNILSTVKPIGA